jgi:hypothetical protein
MTEQRKQERSKGVNYPMGGLITVYYYGHGPSLVLASIYPFVNSLECGTVALN